MVTAKQKKEFKEVMKKMNKFEGLSIGIAICIVVFIFITLVAYVLMTLWNNLSPVFGIDIQLTMWQVVKMWVFMMIIKWMVIK